MKKFVLICAVVAVFVIYAVLHHDSDDAIAVGKNNGSFGTVVTASAQTSSNYKDGKYTGSSEDAFYGTVQVQTTITSGKITDVQFVQYPNDRGDSIEINQQAMPMLKQEAIQAQSAKVNIVSGATQTSQAFTKSLADALTQAK